MQLPDESGKLSMKYALTMMGAVRTIRATTPTMNKPTMVSVAMSRFIPNRDEAIKKPAQNQRRLSPAVDMAGRLAVLQF
jgi:hypothetical protein